MIFSELLQNAIINLIPHWTLNLLSFLNIGNEYNTIINLVLNQIVKNIEFVDDKIYIGIIVIIIILLLCYKLKLFNGISLYTSNTCVLEGIEYINSNEIMCNYSDKILSLIDYLIEVKNIQNIIVFGNNKTINDIPNVNIYDDIYLTVKRNNSIINNNGNLSHVCFTLISYNTDIEKFLNKIVEDYQNKYYSEIVLIGNENNSINYPEKILAINYYILNIKKLYFPKLMCLTSFKFCKIKTNNNDNNNNNNNNINNNVNVCDNDDNNDNYKTNIYDYTLNNINNFKIDDNIELSISRNTNIVNYIIRSKTIQCKDWLENIVEIYNDNKSCKFKNRLIIYGYELPIIGYSTSSKMIQYTNLMLALNWHIIENLGFQKYEYIGDINLIYNYIIEPINLLKIETDLYLSIDKEISKNKLCNSVMANNTKVIYTLYSNELNIKEKINYYLQNFEEKNKKNNKIYKFTYNGIVNNLPSFNTHLLSEKNTENELFETFDKIHNEHAEMLKNDIDKLKNIEYYKKHGLKRKKGYLFYGIPGCGKTSSVVAMALYDNRHIIEIQFSQIKSNDEFDKIMNLTSINNISINNNNIILLFDEINYGFEELNKYNKNITNIETSINNLVKTLSDESIDKSDNNNDSNKLNIGTILSKLDGIANYNGLIIVATTNYINKIEPAIYRDMRLSPIEFKQLRYDDCLNIIISYFNDIDKNYIEKIIKDRIITPARLILLCSTYNNMSSKSFIDDILVKEFNQLK